jgi:hypothetical protein
MAAGELLVAHRVEGGELRRIEAGDLEGHGDAPGS